jgi:hypothetical protein
LNTYSPATDDKKDVDWENQKPTTTHTKSFWNLLFSKERGEEMMMMMMIRLLTTTAVRVCAVVGGGGVGGGNGDGAYAYAHAQNDDDDDDGIIMRRPRRRLSKSSKLLLTSGIRGGVGGGGVGWWLFLLLLFSLVWWLLPAQATAARGSSSYTVPTITTTTTTTTAASAWAWIGLPIGPHHHHHHHHPQRLTSKKHPLGIDGRTLRQRRSSLPPSLLFSSRPPPTTLTAAATATATTTTSTTPTRFLCTTVHPLPATSSSSSSSSSHAASTSRTRRGLVVLLAAANDANDSSRGDKNDMDENDDNNNNMDENKNDDTGGSNSNSSTNESTETTASTTTEQEAAKIIEDCARTTVEQYLAEYDKKALDTLVTVITDSVLEFLQSTQEVQSKEQLAIVLKVSFGVTKYLSPSIKWPDQDATLWSSIVDSFWQHLIQQKILPGPQEPNGKNVPRRIATLDFQIVDSKLTHTFDVDAFIQQVYKTKEAWEEQTATTGGNWRGKPRAYYDAPYFCFIQSSGMGKTKIMYEAVQTLNGNHYLQSQREGCWWKSALVIPGRGLLDRQDTPYSKTVFTHEINFPTENVNLSISARTTECFNRLDELLEKVVAGQTPKSPITATTTSPTSLPWQPQKNSDNAVLLCFDEAQGYLKDLTWNDEGSNEKVTARDYPFRVIRMWLRLKRHAPVTVVAVFAGTTASIANFRFERHDDAQAFLSARPPSRDWWLDVEMHEKGNRFFPVFTSTTTIGCLADSMSSSLPEDSDSFKRAILFGRPLFAKLDREGRLDGAVMTSILGRMLQVRTMKGDWRMNDASLFSVLATRVQMGQTSYPIASQLVSNGYANLLGVSEKEEQLRITFMQDPVCARLAMGMMSDSFQQGPFQGMGGTFWAEKLSALFQTGICVPEKGNAGEIFVALYFLLCGDILRTAMNSLTMNSFTINLDEWIRLVKNGGHRPDNVVNAEQHDFSINFIQVCRNNLRSFDRDWTGFKNQTFLRYLFDSAVAFYTYKECPLIDFVAPIKINCRNKDPYFIPLLVSIKAGDTFSPGEASLDCARMIEKAQKSELKAALCLIVVFGSTVASTDYEGLALGEESIAQELLRENFVARVLRVRSDDKFGLLAQFRAMTSPGLETEELFASHSFIRAFDGDNKQLGPKNAIRSDAVVAVQKTLDLLKNQLRRKQG